MLAAIPSGSPLLFEPRRASHLRSSKPLIAPVNRILPFSCVDGPGSRMVVFFQGCNMNCPSCHNPHTIGHCNHCLDCVVFCPSGALANSGVGNKGKLTVDPTLCQSCDSCLVHCDRNCSPYARGYSVEALFAEIQAAALLLDGITFSGGEATLQHRFITQLQAKLKAHNDTAHLNLLIDSNGLLDAKHWLPLLEHCDGVMLDLKAMNRELHHSLTGRDNRKVFASAQLLAKHNKLQELRFLVIEGRNDSEQELTELADFILSLPQRCDLKLNGFRHHGVRDEAKIWPETGENRLIDVAMFFNQQGINTKINSAP